MAPDARHHHRNETLVHLADPQLLALFTPRRRRLTIGGSCGTSSLGDERPVRARRSAAAQHIQFGHRTWDPGFSPVAGRSPAGAVPERNPRR